ncbi:amino acid transporter [Donghicola sp. C2-DW-16]|uniref:Amino acid transporter n=1 Tax=Donghicola mangrovi TaxID=2729614 RepID=A0ABX2PCU8_9RHOB|nr:amino acid transporter [Donghicola mangrovi]NVO26941.1 amino acid transporter [Donghicola mangrovi]
MAPLPDDCWNAWTPEMLAVRLSGLDATWYVAGGWALDLWLGQKTRDHEDLEFVVRPAEAPLAAAHLDDLTFYTARQGALTEARLDQPIPEDVWQMWGADLAAGCWRVDMMIERGTPTTWAYKRAPEVTVPRSLAVRVGAGGIPILAPHLVLLFKARHCRPKDDADFQRFVPILDAKDRADLRDLLVRLHPDHKWIAAL